MKWVTREHVHVDRVACPWLIKRFIDPEAKFIFVPPEKIQEVVKKQGAIPYDCEGVELGHKGDKCTFDAIIEKYNVSDPFVKELALIVRAADTGNPSLAPEATGLEAISAGAMMIVKDDYEAIQKGNYIYDSLYAYLKLKHVRKQKADL